MAGAKASEPAGTGTAVQWWSPGAISAAYVEARGRAQGTSTWRLRRRLRRMPWHSVDPMLSAKRAALRDELAVRGVSR